MLDVIARFLGPRGENRARALLPVAITALLGLLLAAADDGPPVTDESVDTAIRRAVEWIKSQRNDQGHWEEGGGTQDQHWAGTSGLAMLSLLYAGEDPRESELARSLDWLASQTLNGTYTYGTRAHVLALVPGGKFNARLRSDLDWLLAAIWQPGTEHPGAYDYTPPTPGQKSGRWDNSVTQYGVLGVWMAADAGLLVPDSYWEIVGQHWMRCQNTDGGWSYQKQDHSTGSMTAAGLASLFVVLDQRYADRPKDAGGLLTAIDRGMSWFGREYRADQNPGGEQHWLYYYLYGVERVGRASGYKYFREKDWFRDGAAFLLAAQDPEGHWGLTGQGMDSVRNTAFALMFLCHGRAPLLLNKLEHGPDWKNRLRDVAGLTRYAGHAFEHC